MNSGVTFDPLNTARPSRFHLNVLLLTGFTWVWVAYGVTIVGFILPALRQEWPVSDSALGLLAGVGMLGMLAGAILAGSLADSFGRRTVLGWTMLAQALFFALSALAPTYPALLTLRFPLGLALGAALPVAGTLLSEFSPARLRGTLMVLLNLFWGLGASLSAAAGSLLVLPLGWRPALWFGTLAALSGLLVFTLLPESLRFLAGRGRFAQLEQETRRLGLEPVLPLEGQVVRTAGPEREPDTLWERRYLKLHAALWTLWIALNFLYQGVYVWLPTLLIGSQNGIRSSYGMTLMISLGQVPGTLLAAVVADRFSRRQLLILSQVLVALSMLFFPLGRDPGWTLGWGFMIMMSNGMAMGLGHPFTTEVYPTRIRARANGWASGIGRLGGVAAPIAVGALLQAGAGLAPVFWLLAAAPLFTIPVLAGLKLETTGRTLEEIQSAP